MDYDAMVTIPPYMPGMVLDVDIQDELAGVGNSPAESESWWFTFSVEDGRSALEMMDEMPF